MHALSTGQMICHKYFNVRMLLLFSTLLFSGCEWLEYREYSFQNKVELLDSEAWKGGWVPANLVPNGATDIKIKYFFDTNHTWISFTSSLEDFSYFDDFCKEDAAIQLPQSFRVKSIKWWPANINDQRVAATNSLYVFMDCSLLLDGMVAVDSITRTRYYYWYTP